MGGTGSVGGTGGAENTGSVGSTGNVGCMGSVRYTWGEGTGNMEVKMWETSGM